MKKQGLFPRIYLILVLILMYVPILLVVIFSFNESKLTTIWEGFTLDWYVVLFNDSAMFEALLNSIILATLSSCAAGVIGTLGAVGMARTQYKSNQMIEYVATLPIMIPEIILGMVFLTFFSLIGLPFGMTTLVIAHTTFCVPYVFMLVKARLVGIDKSFVESAKDLGASEFRAFFDITVPLVAPAIFSGMFLAFAMSFDDVIISVFVTGATVNTLPLKIYTQLKTSITPEVNAMCALIFAVTIVCVLLSMIFNKKRSPKT